MTVGPFLSTMPPEIGPAVRELPTASARSLLPVEALAVSVPAATLVESAKLASAAFASPEPASWAVQLRLMSLADQPVGIGSQL